MTGTGGVPPSVRARRAADERRIGRLLIGITYVAVAALVLGVTAMLVAGVHPFDAAPSLDASSFWAALTSLRPEAILWIGLALVIATPILRVVAAAVSYARSGERRMLLVSLAILAVIAIALLSAQLTETAVG